MINETVEKELIAILSSLDTQQQREVLAYARQLRPQQHSSPISSETLLNFVGRIPKGELELIEMAIADCERVEIDGW